MERATGGDERSWETPRCVGEETGTSSLCPTRSTSGEEDGVPRFTLPRRPFGAGTCQSPSSQGRHESTRPSAYLPTPLPVLRWYLVVPH